MGKGKGAPDHFVAVIKPGRILFEIGGVPWMLQKKLYVSSTKTSSKNEVCSS